MTNRKRKIYQAELLGERKPRGGTEFVQDWDYFAQTPQNLIRNPGIPSQAKALFALYHSYCSQKKLPNRPATIVSQKTLARDMGWHRNKIGRYQKVLEEWGWITVKHRGFHQPCLIILHGRRKRVRSGRTER